MRTKVTLNYNTEWEARQAFRDLVRKHSKAEIKSFSQLTLQLARKLASKRYRRAITRASSLIAH